MLRSLRRHLFTPNGFAGARTGVSAVEFALILPAMLLLLFGTTEVGRYLVHARDLNLTVDAMAVMISRTNGSLTESDAKFVRDSAMLSFPDALTGARTLGVDWTSHLKIGMSGIVFTQVPNSCNPGPCRYYSNASWTAGHTDVRKICSPVAVDLTDARSSSLVSSAEGATPTTGSLPMNMIGGRFSVIAVVASIPYVPLFGSAILPSLTLTRGAYYVSRYTGTISYSPGSDPSFGTACPSTPNPPGP